MPNKSFIASMSPERLLLARIFRTIPARSINAELDRRAASEKTPASQRRAA